MPKILANGLSLHYWQSGQGPDIVLIHGLGGNLAGWHLTTLLLEATTGTDSPSSMPLAEPSEPTDPKAGTLLVSLLSLAEEEEEA